MNWDRIQENWEHVKARIKNEWDRLAGDDVEPLLGRRDRLLDKIQEVYGISREEAEAQLHSWEMDCGEKQTLDAE